VVKIGIVGLGRIATEFHIPSLRRIKGASVTAICARTATDERVKLANSLGAEFYDDYQNMVSSAALDAVYLCSPTVLHREMAITAFNRGLHIFCEKPIAMNVEEAKAMCAAGHKSGRFLFIGYNRRFSPTYRKVKQFSEQHGINLLLLEKTRGALVRSTRSEFDRRAREEAAIMGPELLEFGVHFVDLAKWICGNVVDAHFTSSWIEGVSAYPGNGVAVFKHKNGSRSMMYMTIAGGNRRERSTALADEGTCETDGGMFGRSRVLITRGDEIEEFQSSDDPVEAGGFLQENEYFLNVLESGQLPVDETADIIDTLALSLKWSGEDE